jgi:hypothetical protein
MIATKSDMNACYQAVKNFDEAEAVLLRAVEIMASLCTHDIYDAMGKVRDRRGEFDQAIRSFRTMNQAPVVPQSISEYLGDRTQAKYASRAARAQGKAEEPWWNETGVPGAVQRPVDDDGVEGLRGDLSEVAFEASEAWVSAARRVLEKRKHAPSMGDGGSRGALVDSRVP